MPGGENGERRRGLSVNVKSKVLGVNVFKVDEKKRELKHDQKTGQSVLCQPTRTNSAFRPVLPFDSHHPSPP